MPSGDELFCWLGKTMEFFWPPRSAMAMQAAALGSSIGTALVGGLVTGEHKK